MHYPAPKAFCKAALLCLLMAACSEEGQDELEGKWQLREVSVNEEEPQTVDTVWYNFQNTLFMYQLCNADGSAFRYCYGFKIRNGGKFTLALQNNPVPNDTFLPFTDWPAAERTFIIEKRNNKELTLKSGNKQYFFRKF